MMIIEASTARELSFYYRTFDQESERVFNRIREFCELGRYTCLMTVQKKHTEQLLKLLNDCGYKCYAKPLVKITDDKQTIRISWED